jgi:hypothetical protein
VACGSCTKVAFVCSLCGVGTHAKDISAPCASWAASLHAAAGAVQERVARGLMLCYPACLCRCPCCCRV